MSIRLSRTGIVLITTLLLASAVAVVLTRVDLRGRKLTGDVVVDGSCPSSSPNCGVAVSPSNPGDIATCPGGQNVMFCSGVACPLCTLPSGTADGRCYSCTGESSSGGSSSSLPLCPAQYEYTTTIGSTARVTQCAYPTGTVTTCPSAPGYTFVDSECLVNGGVGSCLSQICLWRKASTANFDYTMTHQGLPGSTCPSQLPNTVHCDQLPPAGFTLNTRQCAISDPVNGGCISDVCFWQKLNTASTTHELLLSHDGDQVSDVSTQIQTANVNCQSIVPSTEYSLNKRVGMLSFSNNTYSDLCLWEKAEQCAAQSSSSNQSSVSSGGGSSNSGGSSSGGSSSGGANSSGGSSSGGMSSGGSSASGQQCTGNPPSCVFPAPAMCCSGQWTCGVCPANWTMSLSPSGPVCTPPPGPGNTPIPPSCPSICVVCQQICQNGTAQQCSDCTAQCGPGSECHVNSSASGGSSSNSGGSSSNGSSNSSGSSSGGSSSVSPQCSGYECTFGGNASCINEGLGCVQLNVQPCMKCQGLCGNHLLDPGEECDDGNTVDLDKCDHLCHLENNYCSFSSSSDASSSNTSSGASSSGNGSSGGASSSHSSSGSSAHCGNGICEITERASIPGGVGTGCDPVPGSPCLTICAADCTACTSNSNCAAGQTCDDTLAGTCRNGGGSSVGGSGATGVSSSSNSSSNNTCTDTDGGDVPDVVGTTTVSGSGFPPNIFYDHCEVVPVPNGQHYLLDAYCSPPTMVASSHDCSPKSCVNGFCATPSQAQAIEQQCADSDGGTDQLVKGTVTAGGQTYTDSCDPSSGFLNEEYCSGGTHRTKVITCSCTLGRCNS